MSIHPARMMANNMLMRKIIFGSAVSVDGFIEGPNGELDWLEYDEGIFDPVAFASQFDTVFFGRKAYEKFAVASAADRQWTATRWLFYLTVSQMRKYVFSRTEKHLAGNGMVISANIAAEVDRIRREHGKNIWFGGGADILKTLAALDLIDEYVFMVHPVALRIGKPLFEGRKRPLDLHLLDQYRLPSGVMTLRYQPQSRIEK
jgi:dihydrofolate reductase